RVKDEPGIRTWSPYRLRFIESHVWAALEPEAENVVVVGITDFGQRILGDILSATLPKVGDHVAGGAALGWIDCYRRAFDVVSPLSGEVVAVNPDVVRDPAHINA